MYICDIYYEIIYYIAFFKFAYNYIQLLQLWNFYLQE